MQTLVDIPDTDLQALAALANARNLTPQDLILQAISQLVTEKAPTRSGIDESFGLWRDRQDIGDGVEYQQRLRAEWQREWDVDPPA